MKRLLALMLFAVSLGAGAQTTFNVDMSCAPEFDNVFVTGTWCGWCANDVYNTMTDPDGDGIYTVTLDESVTGTTLIEYKYGINNFYGQEWLVNDMVEGAACAPVTDFSGYANRQIAAGLVANDHYGTCDGVCNDSGCTDPEACNFEGDSNPSFDSNPFFFDDGSCLYFDALGVCGGYCIADTNDNGICDADETIFGCTDDFACNYDAEANVDDGSCDFDSCASCTDTLACNYSPEATIDDGSCLFVGDACDDFNKWTFDDALNDYCECIGEEFVAGCTDEAACNYNAEANVDDGSCGEVVGTACDDEDALTINDMIAEGCSCVGEAIVEVAPTRTHAISAQSPTSMMVHASS